MNDLTKIAAQVIGGIMAVVLLLPWGMVLMVRWYEWALSYLP